MRKTREHEIHTRSLHYELDPGEVPDMPIRYTKTKVIRPDSLVIKLRWNGETHRWELGEFIVGGRRVLKNGLSEYREGSTYSGRFDFDYAPQELQDLVRYVLGLVN